MTVDMPLVDLLAHSAQPEFEEETLSKILVRRSPAQRAEISDALEPAGLCVRYIRVPIRPNAKWRQRPRHQGCRRGVES
jgi:uroporphyrinogen-III synthase